MADESQDVSSGSAPSGIKDGQAIASACSILVLGAGELGMAVLRQIAQRARSVPGLTLSVFLRPEGDMANASRKREQAAELRTLGVRLVYGDLAQDSEVDLATVFQRFHTVIGCTGFVAGRTVQLKLARAALAGAVKRYLPWQFGVDYDVIGKGSAQDLFDEQIDVRGLLRSQTNTEWIIVSTGMFTSFLFEPLFGVVDLSQNTVRALGSWENSVTVTTAEDIGKLTAEILFAEPKIRNRVLHTAGDTVTYSQLAHTIDSLLHRKVERVLWTVPMLKRQLAADPTSTMAKYRLVFAEGTGVAWPVEQTFNYQNALPVIGVERWVQERFGPEPSQCVPSASSGPPLGQK